MDKPQPNSVPAEEFIDGEGELIGTIDTDALTEKPSKLEQFLAEGPAAEHLSQLRLTLLEMEEQTPRISPEELPLHEFHLTRLRSLVAITEQFGIHVLDITKRLPEADHEQVAALAHLATAQAIIHSSSDSGRTLAELEYLDEVEHVFIKHLAARETS